MAAAGAGAGELLKEINRKEAEEEFIRHAHFLSETGTEVWRKQLEECVVEIKKMLKELKLLMTDKAKNTNGSVILSSISSPYQGFPESFDLDMTIKIQLTAEKGLIGKDLQKVDTISINLPNIRNLFFSLSNEKTSIQSKLKYIYNIICLDILAAIFKYVLANNYHLTGQFPQLLKNIQYYINTKYPEVPEIINEIIDVYNKKGGEDEVPHIGGAKIFDGITYESRKMLTASASAGGATEARAAGGAAAPAAAAAQVQSEEVGERVAGGAAAAGAAATRRPLPPDYVFNNSNNNSNEEAGAGAGGKEVDDEGNTNMVAAAGAGGMGGKGRRRRRSQTKRRHHKKRKQTRRRR
jgi:hypothetical protein